MLCNQPRVVYTSSMSNWRGSNDFVESNRMTTARNTIMNANIAPRVFLSYARDDGEPFATELRQRLEAEHIPLWQDRVGLEGGRDWWLQIVAALDRVEFMVNALKCEQVWP